MKFPGLLVSLLFASSSSIFAGTLQFQDQSLNDASENYELLKAEAPAQYEYAVRFNYGEEALDLLAEDRLKTVLESSILNSLCGSSANVLYTCPDRLILNEFVASTYERVEPLIKNALSSSRPSAEKSEYFFDLSTKLTDMVNDPEAYYALYGSESNSFGSAEVITVTSLKTGETIFIGSGWVE
ncbi:MAG TPA: hypothetical protein VE954_19480 [Oligoflexus sp.]|uniref:hypothetical protein n=1 Tax=Oligoflexus sp. TaxID=1971216 RepID=UPI002D4BE9A5|nr:hypothetical protein [Oligoflexus sp.]HYX35284.1 hypothetical protein [Oligoflexus sp.]